MTGCAVIIDDKLNMSQQCEPVVRFWAVAEVLFQRCLKSLKKPDIAAF